MTIDMLREFQLLATYLNYTYVSNILYITQPTLTKHINQLEEELSQTLFIRTTKGVQLTYAGQIFLESAVAMLKTWDRALSDLSFLGQMQTGSLDIGFTVYAIDEILRPVTKALSEEYPGIQLNLTSPAPEDPVNLVLRDEIDIAETYRLPFAGSELLTFQNAGRLRFLAVLPEGHRLADREEITISELQGETFVFTKAYPLFNSYIRNYFFSHGMTFSSVFTVTNPQLMLYTVRNSGSAAIISEAEMHAGYEGCVFVPIGDPDFFITVAFAWKKSNSNPCIPVFSKVLSDTFPGI